MLHYQRTFILMMMLCSIAVRVSSFPAILQRSDNLQSLTTSLDKARSAPDIAATIDQVHKMLQEDSTLPRLTRGEIEELFDQVTKEEYEKSLQTGDISRANNMRALMLVLPYNTNNTTEENLQELYTRPPITKVIDTYSIPRPQKFQTPASVTSGKVDIVEVGNLDATTYKPSFRIKQKINLQPTTYHPEQIQFKMPQLTTAQVQMQVPVTSLPLLPDIEEEQIKGTRYSSSYNAKDTDWSLLEGESNRKNNLYQKFTPMPELSATKRFKLEDYFQAAKTSMSSTIKQKERYPGTIDIADFTRTLPPRPHLEAYSQFKPLNIGEEIRVQPEIEQYLNRFGIVNRKRKQIKPEDSSVPSESKDIEVKSPVEVEASNSRTVNESIKDQPIRRIDTDVSGLEAKITQDEGDLVQLKKLLNNLQELERLNVSLTADMLKAVDLGNFNLSSGIQAQGPNPVDSVTDSMKNFIKRQNSNDSTTDPIRINLDLDLNAKDDSTTSTSTTTTQESSSTTEEPRNGSLADLEDSFGGPDPITEDPSPPPKKNGFYFLADWNSFLEVGEAGKDQVVVRFDPKIGEAKRFLKVTVP